VSFNRNVCRQLRTGGAVVSATVLASAAIAFAAHPVNGEGYSGHVTGQPTETVSFKVSKDGKRVTKLLIPLVVHCPKRFGGFGGVASPSAGKATITKKGTFTKTLTVLAVTGAKAGTETVTGTFLADGKERGKIASNLTGKPKACDTTVKYTTVD
jgi:hypothetical protein